MQPIYWLNEDARKFLGKDYLLPGVTPERRMRQIADYAEAILGISGWADKFESYLHRGWYSLASPIWSNFGAGRGLSISCNGSYVGDSIDEITEKIHEVSIMTKHGAGTSAYFGDIRPRGAPIRDSGNSFGAVHFMGGFDYAINMISQSNVRRGQLAAYLPVDHPDFMEMLDVRTEGNPLQKIFIGACISDEWMSSLKTGDKAKLKIWKAIIKRRRKGIPYIFFTDTVNRNAPQVYKDKGLKIHASNLCSEIALSSSPDESFVCCLSSMNLVHYHQWKNTDAVEVMMQLLDASMTDYINQTESMPMMQAARRFAINQRAVGLGVLGWHSLLQKSSIPFESMEAKFLNVEIHRTIQKQALAASQKMAVMYGEPPLLKGYGQRNATTMAIAPTKSSAFILGQVSEGIQPLDSNYYIDHQAKGVFTRRNPDLEKLLRNYGKDTDATWKSILTKGGSVQHLTFLTQHEKDVFKTFSEISPKEVLIQAGARQRFIDQSQSLNLMVPADATEKQISDLMLFAHETGVKTLYYQLSSNPAQQLVRDLMTCRSCEG